MTTSQIFQDTGVTGQGQNLKVTESGTPFVLPAADIPVPSKSLLVLIIVDKIVWNYFLTSSYDYVSQLMDGLHLKLDAPAMPFVHPRMIS